MRSTSTFQQYIGRPSRSYRRNVANGASDARENTGWRAVRSPDRRGAKILGISHGESRKRTPTVLSLIADGNSVVWTARPLEGRKTSKFLATCAGYRQRERKEFHENHARGEDSRNSRRPKAVARWPPLLIRICLQNAYSGMPKEVH